MIRNIIFDMGNVLVRFDPQTFVDRLDLPEEDKGLLLKEVFGSPLWIELDRGSVTEEKALADMRRHLPDHLHDAAAELLHWWEDLIPIPGMAQLIGELKEKGYGLYTLSNAPTNLHLYFPRIPGNERMDGLVVSADHKLLKPQKALYEVLLNKYSLKGEECFFIDDTHANVEGARTAGLHGTVFLGDVEILREDLRKAGIL